LPIRRRNRFTLIDDLNDGAEICIAVDVERGRAVYRARVVSAFAHGFDADSVDPAWSGGGWFKYEDEGSEWCRGWEGLEVDAFRAATAIS
jgi:hypothetical protein